MKTLTTIWTYIKGIRLNLLETGIVCIIAIVVCQYILPGQKGTIVIKQGPMNTLPAIVINPTNTITNIKYLTIAEASDELNQYRTNAFVNRWDDPWETITLYQRTEKLKIESTEVYRWLIRVNCGILPDTVYGGGVEYRIIQSLPVFIGISTSYDAPSKGFSIGPSCTILLK